MSICFQTHTFRVGGFYFLDATLVRLLCSNQFILEDFCAKFEEISQRDDWTKKQNKNRKHKAVTSLEA